ncbi:hypothetical protein ATO10_07922 [Actibacterium atlanticum]|uniref:Copper chaperone PCu(A)C n=1 Tax=Actibacterium atlanticum TaxID=1461693 RepID=A0A058ZND2_9RHOB|nr:copper chaperone PCu(A)C [Actibacterium atlanticum]KCV82301.1 hypothetical protein ATO10_07922 [Actibacterium atlanticum]
MKRFALALMCLPGLAFAEGLTIEEPMVPLAPPGVMAHAAFMQITNTGDSPRQLVGVSSPDYAMAHIHQTSEQNGIATMSGVDLIEIAPGQTVAFAHGGLHIMLMHPKAALAEGDTVNLSLLFANGAVEPVTAKVMRQHRHGS